MAKKILVIDDNETNVALVQARLEKKEYDVVVAYDGDTGLDVMEKEMPDLILLDVQMPIMSGYEFMVEKEKKDDPFKSIPVIILTAHDEMQPIFQRRGVEGYLIKPINFDALYQKMNECLGS